MSKNFVFLSLKMREKAKRKKRIKSAASIRLNRSVFNMESMKPIFEQGSHHGNIRWKLWEYSLHYKIHSTKVLSRRRQIKHSPFNTNLISCVYASYYLIIRMRNGRFIQLFFCAASRLGAALAVISLFRHNKYKRQMREKSKWSSSERGSKDEEDDEDDEDDGDDDDQQSLFKNGHLTIRLEILIHNESLELD